MLYYIVAEFDKVLETFKAKSKRIPNQIKIYSVPHWHRNGSTQKISINFSKNLFNFMFVVLSPNLIVFGSAPPGHDLTHCLRPRSDYAGMI